MNTNFLFKDEETKNTWESLKNGIEGDLFAQEIISFTENWAIKIQLLLGDDPEKIIFAENWDERELKTLNKQYATISDFQEALNNEILYESEFGKIINSAFTQVRNSKITFNYNEKAIGCFCGDSLNIYQIKCVQDYLITFWKYGKQFETELKRKDKANELKKRLLTRNRVL